jgi:hypothetical protein
MKRSVGLLGAWLVFAGISVAGSNPQAGTIVASTSVACGAKKSKNQELDLLCHQYVVRSGKIDYTIRQAKPSEIELIPLSTEIQFTLEKNKMKFKVNGKSFEFLVTSQAAATAEVLGVLRTGLDGG